MRSCSAIAQHPRGAAAEEGRFRRGLYRREFIGVLFVDDEDDDRSYNFQMAILQTDLE